MDNEQETLPKMAKKLEKYIMTLPSSKQFNTLDSEPRKAMMALTGAAYNVRVDVERFFHADDSSEQVLFLNAAIEQAEKLNDYILTASQFDLLGPVDVAHLSALNEHILERLK